jgi:ADP-heptose:LPS heptosyltransferase
MHLVECYATTLRLRIDKPVLIDEPFELPFKGEYAITTASTGMPGKNYKHWNTVFRLLHLNIPVVQIGLKDDPELNVDYCLCGQTSVKQMFNLIKNATLCVCGDTSMVHIASAYDIPIVSVYGLTTPATCGPYWGTKKKQIILEPDRKMFPASFNPNDDCVNTIPPMRVVEAILKMLDTRFVRDQPRLDTKLTAQNGATTATEADRQEAKAWAASMTGKMTL